MNKGIKLPDKLNGKWIWHSCDSIGDRDFLFFKCDFSLFELPAVAEMWIASHTFFKVFLNGRPATYGPIPHPGAGHGAFVMKVDVTHLMEVGVNHIAILAHVENVPLSSQKCNFPGVWMQINVDEEPVVSTGKDWVCCRPKCFNDTGLRTAFGDVFVESMDMNELDYRELVQDVPAVENDSKIENGKWVHPDIVLEPSTESGALEPFAHQSGMVEFTTFQGIKCCGQVEQSYEISWLSFAEAIAKHNEFGVYVGESYLYSPVDQKLSIICVCDEPYIFYLNGRRVMSQAVPPVPMRGTPLEDKVVTIREQDKVNPVFDISLKQGWNKFVFVQNCKTLNSGVTFIWPDLAPASLLFNTKEATSSTHGWLISGPLNAPMALLYANFPFDELVHFTFEQSKFEPNDIGTFYMSCSFKAREENLSALPQELGEQEYILLDFGRTYYAFPHLVVEGEKGDVIDVVCGEICNNSEVIAHEIGVRRNAITLRLRSGDNKWIASTLKGVRYMMVVVRKAAGKIKIKNAELCHEVVDYKNPGSFQSSSPVLDEIWNVGVKTLETTMQRVYIDSPTKEQAQSLPDAMIQSWASYYVFGEYDKAGQAIEQFARSQFETGELNALSPSGMFQAVPDYSLCWPVWLHRHYQHTGDKELVLRMMPYLKKLLFYYNEMAITPEGPIGDLSKYLGVCSFIDFGDLDRRGVSTALNAFYCRALISASNLAAQLEMPDLAVMYRERANSVSYQVWTMNWNEEKGLFADCCINGRQSKKCSWQSSLLAIYGGIAKPKNYDEIWEKLFSDNAPLENMVESEFNNPYFKYYILEVAFALGKAPWALSLIHYYWGQMLKAGATSWWEMFDPRQKDEAERICSKCHGYGVSPSCYLMSELVGIRPAEPGMHMVYFNPLPGDVSWVKASVPTPHGNISVNWKLQPDGTFDVTINSNYIVEVVPVMAPGIAVRAVFHVNDKVSILAEANI